MAGKNQPAEEVAAFACSKEKGWKNTDVGQKRSEVKDSGGDKEAKIAK